MLQLLLLLLAADDVATAASHDLFSNDPPISLHIPTSLSLLTDGIWPSFTEHDDVAVEARRRRIDVTFYVESNTVNDVVSFMVASNSRYTRGEIAVAGLDEFASGINLAAEGETNFDWILMAASPLILTGQFFVALEQMSSGLFDRFQERVLATNLTRVVGVSFLAPTYDGQFNRPIRNQLPLWSLVQQPQTDGAVLSVTSWHAFQQWQQQQQQQQQQASSSSSLGSAAKPAMSYSSLSEFFDTSKRSLFNFMGETAATMVYFNHLRVTDNTTLRGAPLSHTKGGATPDYGVVLTRDLQWQKPTATDGVLLSVAPPFPPQLDLATTPSFNGALLANGAKTTPHKKIDMAPAAQCTMILTVYDRYKDIEDRLLWYHTMLYLRAIYVVWNKIDIPVPKVDATKYRIPVLFAKQEVNSMNNRFRPHDFIQTDCIVNMDDDWNMPHALLNHVIRLWFHTFRNQVVGIRKNARTHGAASVANDAKPTASKWIYMKNASAPMSIVLPSGMVYHRKYLDMYTFSIPQAAREMVDEITNCDDLLFNFMVANHSGTPPVFVRTTGISKVHVIKSGRSGLFTRNKHYVDRDQCLSQMATMFGGMKLKYTPDSFAVDHNAHTIFPGLTDLREIEYVCTRCTGDSEKTDDCITCSESL